MNPKGPTKIKTSLLVFASLLSIPLVDAKADSASYTFETPQFTLNETTPLLNRAPNSSTGSLGAAFLTTFTGTPNASGLTVNTTSSLAPNGLFSGQYLYVPSTTNEVLTMSFNTPVTSLDLDFAIATTSSGGFLRLITTSGNLDQPAISVGGGSGFFGGHASFSSPTAFTSVQVQGFNSPTTQQVFAIENAILTVVPEPTTWAMVVLGIPALLIGCRRRKNIEKRRNA
jgi:hypothetical protein